jgi:hypothetical protein
LSKYRQDYDDGKEKFGYGRDCGGWHNLWEEEGLGMKLCGVRVRMSIHQFVYTQFTSLIYNSNNSRISMGLKEPFKAHRE